MTSKEALDNLKEINRKQNNGNGDLWLESMIIEPIEKDLEILEILKKYIVYDKELNAIKCDGFVLTETHRKEDYEKIVRWLDGKD